LRPAGAGTFFFCEDFAGAAFTEAFLAVFFDTADFAGRRALADVFLAVFFTTFFPDAFALAAAVFFFGGFFAAAFFLTAFFFPVAARLLPSAFAIAPPRHGRNLPGFLSFSGR
jgi:hypothetical protein